MLYVQNHSTNAYFNAALEQYLLHHFDENIFMLWQNENAVVLGKHQVTYKEVNFPYTEENEVQVVRRITGGGTVYHDLGNINFTFIERIEDKHKLIDFRRYLEPMQAAFQRLGIEVEITKTNDLILGGKKISGNAEHVFSQQKKVIHHGTILFNSQLDTLGDAIRSGKGKFQSKGVNSNRSVVTNVSDAMPQSLSVNEFMEMLKDEILADKEYRTHSLTSNDIQAVSEIQQEKFNHWHWNFGYSPAYTFSREHLFGQSNLNVKIRVKNGICETAEFTHNERTLYSDFLLNSEHRLELFQSKIELFKKYIFTETDEQMLLDLFH